MLKFEEKKSVAKRLIRTWQQTPTLYVRIIILRGDQPVCRWPISHFKQSALRLIPLFVQTVKKFSRTVALETMSEGRIAFADHWMQVMGFYWMKLSIRVTEEGERFPVLCIDCSLPPPHPGLRRKLHAELCFQFRAPKFLNPWDYFVQATTFQFCLYWWRLEINGLLLVFFFFLRLVEFACH